MSVRITTCLVCIAALCCSVVAFGEPRTVEVSFWSSADQKEIYISASPSPIAPEGRLYYFSNDASRLCYTFTVPGEWALEPETGLLVSKDRQSRMGKTLESAKELGVSGDGSLVDVKVERLKTFFTLHGYELISMPCFTTESCGVSSRPDCVIFTAEAECRIQGAPTTQKLHAMIVEVTPGWILSVSAPDEIAREAVASLATTSDPECYRPFIRENFPQLHGD